MKNLISGKFQIGRELARPLICPTPGPAPGEKIDGNGGSDFALKPIHEKMRRIRPPLNFRDDTVPASIPIFFSKNG